MIKPEHDSNSYNKIENPKAFEKPDIYYIILDGYGRGDVLESVYGYNNDIFIGELKKRGFVVSDKSNANYGQTLQSLAASLNMEYLVPTDHQEDQDNLYRQYLSSKINDSRIVKVLRDIGYKFVTFSSGYSGTEIKNSDMYISPVYSLDEFDNMIIGTTPLGNLLNIFPDKSPTYLHKLRILYTFNKIPQIPKMDEPMFVFAHIVSPHPPFILIPEGASPDKQATKFINFRDGSHYHAFDDSLVNVYKTKYILQLTEINKLVIKMIDDLFIKRNNDFILILQSDHGPASLLRWENADAIAFRERFSILNAFYYGNKNLLNYSDSLTSVNTFRILLNSLFNTNYELLKNKYYFSKWLTPHIFEQILIEF